MTTDTPETPQALPLPGEAIGLRRALNHVALVVMHAIPGPLRRRMGWWRWDEVLEGGTYGDHLHVRQSQDRPRPDPVTLLRRRGFRPSAQTTPWPNEFKSLHKSWNWDNNWDKVPAEELAAWAAVWRDHPKGQDSLYAALVGNAQRGDLESVATLLSAGANPNPTHIPKSSSDCGLMRQLWGAGMPFETRLAIWKQVCSAENPLMWSSWVEDSPWVKRYGVEDLTAWKQSGLPMPTGMAALHHAKAWVNDPPVSPSHDEGAEAGLAAVRWWKEEGALPPEANTVLLQAWLCSARPGDEDHYQKEVLAWGEELLSDGLPPRPTIGPRWSHMSHVPDDGPQPWSHWVLDCPFFENLPFPLLERLFSEEDSWTAKNQDGNTVMDLFDTGIESIRSQGREVGIARLKAWVAHQRLDNAWAASTPDADTQGTAPRPRL